MEVEIGDSIGYYHMGELKKWKAYNEAMLNCSCKQMLRDTIYIERDDKTTSYINGMQRKRDILLLLGFRNTPFQNSPVYGIKRIVNILRTFNTSKLFLVMKVPIFVAHCQKRKLRFYGNSRENKGGREAPCKQARRHTGSAIPACCKEAPTRWHSFHKNTWICRSSWRLPRYANQTYLLGGRHYSHFVIWFSNLINDWSNKALTKCLDNNLPML